MTNFLSKNTASKQKLDFKTVRNATILLVVLIIPMNYVHEIGHGTICALEGNSFQINIGVENSSLICNGGIKNSILFYGFGGLSVTLLCLLPLIKFQWIRKKPWMIIPLLTLAIGHGINAIIEVSFTQWYLSNDLSSELLLGFIGLFTYFAVLISFGRAK